jgi:hypothetical protein
MHKVQMQSYSCFLYFRFFHFLVSLLHGFRNPTARKKNPRIVEMFQHDDAPKTGTERKLSHAQTIKTKIF